MSIKTKTISKIVSVFVAVAMFVGVVAPVQAMTAAEIQAAIAQLTSELNALSGNTTTTTGLCRPNGYMFTRNLTSGSSGTDVMMLQRVLNTDAQTAIGPAGTAGSAGFETSFYGGKTVAAVGRLQTMHRTAILTPVGLTPRPAGQAYPFGPATRNFVNGLPACGGVVVNPPTTPVSGTVSARVSATSPASTALVAGSGIARLADFTFSNMGSGSVNVTNVSLRQIGISSDTTLSNVYLYDGATRLTDAAVVSQGRITFNQPSGLFTLAAGASRNISVRADIASGTSGQLVGVELTSSMASGVAVAGLPVSAAVHSIATADLATANWNGTVLPSSTATIEPQSDYTVWQSTLSIGTRPVQLNSFALRQVGSIDNTRDLRNFRLLVDGVTVATTANIDANGYVTFSVPGYTLNTGGRVIKVLADVVGGSTKTFSFQLRQASDAMITDTQVGGANIIATVNSSTFTSQNSAVVTISGGALSVIKSNTSPTGNITTDGTNLKFATFEFTATGEDVKIESLDINADATVSNGGLDNGKIFVNGVQVGSTKDLTDATDVNFTFGSSFIVRAGEKAIVDVYADAKTTTAASYPSGATVTVSIGALTSNAQGLSSLNTVNVPGASAIAGNSLTFSSASLSATKFSGYGDQTFVAGTNSARLGSFVLSTGSSEGVNINTITVALSTAEAASITNLWLRDASTGLQIGTTKTTPSDSNAFSVNLNIPASGTKTIDVMANIKTGAEAGAWTAAVTANGTGTLTGNSASASSVTLQTITVGSGSMTVARSGSNPSNDNVIAGGAAVKNGVFRFTALATGFTVQELTVKVPNGAATSVNDVTIKYKDMAGVTHTQTQSLTVGTEAYASATFTGLTMYVPGDDTADLEVWTSIPTIANGATTGTGVTVVLDWDNGFRAQPDGGSTITTIGSADVTSNGDSGKGTMYVKKTEPTITPLANSGSPASTKPIYKFTVTANPAGDVEIRKFTFNVATTSVIVSAMYLKNETTGVNVHASLEANGSGNVVAYAGGALASDSVEVIGAGTTVTYGLYGTVTGWATGDSISVGLVEDTSAVTAQSSAALTSSNFVWSDRALLPHTTTSADWTNGYLVEEMPGTTSW